MKPHRINTFLLIALFVAVGISFLFSSVKERKYDIEKLGAGFQEVFLEREESAQQLLDEIALEFQQKGWILFEDRNWVRGIHEQYENKGEIFLLSQADSILFLSHNGLPVDHYALPRYPEGIIFQENGWYYINSVKFNDYDLWVFSLVKKQYRYKNKFLVNEFQQDYDIPDFFTIVDDAAADGYVILNNVEDYAFSLSTHEGQNLTYTWSLAYTISIIAAIIALLLGIFILFRISAAIYKKTTGLAGAAFLFFSLAALRFLMLYYQVPHILYDLELFSAVYYAQNVWMPSLGDLLLHVIFANTFFFFLFSRKHSNFFSIQQKHLWNWFFIIVFPAIIAFAAAIVLYVLNGLVINSNLSFDVQLIFNIDIYYVVGYVIITGIFFFFYFISSVLFARFREMVQNNSFKAIALLVISLIISAIYYYFWEDQFWLWLLIFCSSFLLWLKSSKGSHVFSLTRFLISFFIFALIATYALFHFNKEKELAHRQNVALRIASEQDPIAEFLFHEIEADLYDDHLLTQMVLNEPYNEEKIANYLKAEYFNDFWAKYDIQVTTCAPGEILVFQPFDQELVCDDYFDFYIENFGRPSLSERLFYLDNNTGRNSYLAMVPVNYSGTDQKAYSLYIEFESRFIPKELGFPELLVDEQIDISRNLGEYSYAIYKNGMMTHKFGSFFFSIHIDSYLQTSDPFLLFESDGYSHLLYNRDDATKIIVSKPRETLLEKIAPFSYLFIFFLITTIIFWLLVQYSGGKIHVSLNFKKRLQISVIAIVLVSVVAIGSASAWFIFNIYENKNEAFINEKAHSILIEMENHFSAEPYLDLTYQDYLNQLLLQLSQVFFTDINIFHPDGSLLASSRPKVFQEGLIAPVIHPVAYNELVISGKSLFIHNERIGNLEYISAYVPLRNVEGDLIAYINLPYFAQQSELRNEISYFLVAFINIYLLLLLLSIVIAFFISNHVTRPLQIIRDSISRLSIGKMNEKINWKRNDEIGQLVGEYNRMIDELEISADLLARSERESAWREMAKQVAHEIKNPLTPMRLNVQYLQRAWKDKVDDYEERLDRFTKTMVEQIDTLTLIASEFSDFAKMPAANNQIINISEFIPEVLDLYKGFDKVKIDYHLPENQENLLIFADRKQLLRVFNNLIKNAIQAYSRSDVASIFIQVEVESNFCKIEIKDFGGGIGEEIKKNIFQPYFTTKTAGMGLGLAMVKSIIQSFNGHISFESEKGKGTSFRIRIPLVSSNVIKNEQTS